MRKWEQYSYTEWELILLVYKIIIFKWRFIIHLIINTAAYYRVLVDKS